MKFIQSGFDKSNQLIFVALTLYVVFFHDSIYCLRPLLHSERPKAENAP